LVLGGGAFSAEQWLQRHPEAGSSWPSWPKASRGGRERRRTVGGEVVAGRPVFGGHIALGDEAPPVLPHAFHEIDLPLKTGHSVK